MERETSETLAPAPVLTLEEYDERWHRLADESFGKGEACFAKFEEELMENLRHLYYGGLPLSVLALTRQNGTLVCYDRAVQLIHGLSDDAVLNGGYTKGYELGDPGEDSFHFWVEDGDWVYDGTAGFKFKKEVWYQCEEPRVFSTRTKAECQAFAKSEWQPEVFQWEDDEKEVITDSCYPLNTVSLRFALPGFEARADTFHDPERFRAEVARFKESIDYDKFVAEFEKSMESELND
jgi:hypothetical protein